MTILKRADERLEGALHLYRLNMSLLLKNKVGAKH